MPEEPHEHHRFVRPPPPALIVVIAAVAIFAVAFTSGFWASRLLDEVRVTEQAETRFGEFLTTGIELGFVTIDRRKLEELECIVAEGELEDAEPYQTPPIKEDSQQPPCGRTGRE